MPDLSRLGDLWTGAPPDTIMYKPTAYATGQDNPKATWLGLSDTDPSSTNGWEMGDATKPPVQSFQQQGKLQTLTGGWDSIHKPSHLYPLPPHMLFDPDTATRDTVRLDMIDLELQRLGKEQRSLAKQLYDEERRRRSDRECVQLQLISLAEQMDDMVAELGGDE